MWMNDPSLDTLVFKWWLDPLLQVELTNKWGSLLGGTCARPSCRGVTQLEERITGIGKAISKITLPQTRPSKIVSSQALVFQSIPWLYINPILQTHYLNYVWWTILVHHTELVTIVANSYPSKRCGCVGLHSHFSSTLTFALESSKKGPNPRDGKMTTALTSTSNSK